MNEQIWSWILGAVGLIGFILVGKKIWWSWWVNIGNQFIWLAYSIVTQQWGFLAVTIFYFAVFLKNAIQWTTDHFDSKKHLGWTNEPIGRISKVTETDDGLIVVGTMNQDAAEELRQALEERMRGKLNWDYPIIYNAGGVEDLQLVRDYEEDLGNNPGPWLRHSADNDLYSQVIWSNYMKGDISRETASELLRRK